MLSVLRHTFTPRIALMVLVEVLVFFSLLVAVPAMLGHTGSVTRGTEALLFAAFITFTLAVVQFSLWSFGLYSRDLVYCGNRLLSKLGLSTLFSIGLLVPCFGLYWFVRTEGLDFPVHAFAAAFLCFTAYLVIERLVILRLTSAGKRFMGNVLILGTGSSTTALVAEVEERYQHLLSVVGILTTEPKEVGTRLQSFPVLDLVDRIRDHVDQSSVSTILVNLPRHSTNLPAAFLVKCKLAGIRVVHIGDFYESLTKKVLLENFSPLDFLYRSNLFMSKFKWFAKSVFEKTMALILLIAALPVMAIAAVIVRLTSPGPILYRQVRVGENGAHFEVMKFRSMGVDAEKNGAVWAQQNDPRVTTWGKIMRKTRIDELPQIFNILRGDMSFVGPRPERPEFVEQLVQEIPHYDQRHLVKPGLTGWAQVAFRYGGSIEDTAEKLRYDLYYIKNTGLSFDFLIILSTIRTVIYGGGAR